MASKRTALIDTKVIYCGDCLDQLRDFPDRCVDLIYIDPPFNSNRDYEVFWGEAREKRGFEDRHASTQAYIEFLRPRCIELHRVLKEAGSFYFHCDWHATHYVRAMLDQIFGENQFRSEIVWRRTFAKGLASKGFANNHDTIHYYVKGDGFTWNPLYLPYDPNHLDATTESKYSHYDPDGRRYQLDNLTNPNANRPNLTYEFLGTKKVWRWTRERMEEAYKAGLVVQPKPGSVPRFKRYLDEQEGRALDDMWTDIPPINSQALERMGYPTQKPLPLLERIVEASSRPDDVILDGFCGCGTALVAAERLGRKWVGIDISPTACRIMAQRLKRDSALHESEPLWRAGKGFIVRDLPWTEQRLRRLPPFEFENWTVIAIGGIPNKAKVGDMGIDGRIFPVSASPLRRGAQTGEFDFMDVWYPIQVEQTDRLGRPKVDAFETAMERTDRNRGFMVAFGFSNDALTEIDRYFRKTGKIIVALTVKDILDEQVAQKLA